MTDRRDQDYTAGPVDATGEPVDLEQVNPPQQAPMDDAAGGPDVADESIDETPTGDLSAQAGD